MRLSQKTREAAAGFLYILPSTLLILIFSVIPIAVVLYLGFAKYNVLQPAQWVGIANYARLVKDGFVGAGLKNTIAYTALVVPLQTALALLLAALIASRFRGRFGNVIMAALFVPVISSSILVGTIWIFLLSVDGGAFNQFLGFFGISRVNWLGTIATALPSIAAASIWKGTGYFLVIYYAGIMDVPNSLYEAARVDGASPLQQFLKITVPMLKPITLFVVVLGTIWSFQVFDLVYIMTNGGPGRSTVTLSLTIYSTAFKEYNMGYASSIAVLLFFIILLISVVQRAILRGSDKAEGAGGWS